MGMHEMVGGYRVLDIPCERPLNDSELSVLAELSLLYSRADLLLEAHGKAIRAHLRELDIREFSSALLNLLATHGVSPKGSPLVCIPQSIEAIGSYGIRGSKRVFVGFNRERKVKNRRQKERNRSAHFYARGHSFSKDASAVPERLADHIVCGDSGKVLAQLPDNCVDLMFTSPPYNFGLEYDGGDDAAFWETYFAKLFAIFDQVIRVLKFGGRAVVNIQPLFSDYIPSHHIISNFFMQRKMIWKGEIVWEKSNYNCKYTAWGSWKSPSSPYLKYTWEFLEVFAKGDLKKDGRAEDVDITADEFKRWVVARWQIAPERNMAAYGHPAMFPEELASRVLKLFSFRNDLVLDPFNGVGTTTAVAARLGRRFLGIDISADYCRKARQRLRLVQRPLALTGA